MHHRKSFSCSPQDEKVILYTAEKYIESFREKLEFEYSNLIKVRGMSYVEPAERDRALSKDHILASYRSGDVKGLAKHLLKQEALRQDFIESVESTTSNPNYLIPVDSLGATTHGILSSLKVLGADPFHEFPGLFARTKEETKIPLKAARLIETLGLKMHQWSSEDDGVIFTIEVQGGTSSRQSSTLMNFFPMRRKNKLQLIVGPENFTGLEATDSDDDLTIKSLYVELIKSLEG